MATKYQAVRAASRAHGESSDCTVVAVSILCRVPYDVAHRAMAQRGRLPRRGAWSDQWLGAIRDLGFQHSAPIVPTQRNGSRYTAKTIGHAFPEGRYIVKYRGHIAALVDGQIEDWTDGRRHRVEVVYRITV